MKKILIYLILFLISASVTGQDVPQLSQYMFNLPFINPGASGSKDEICLGAVSRQSWVNFEGAPQTIVFNGNAPFSLFGINSGGGLTIYNDNYGFTTQYALSGSYAYRLSLGNGKLGIGAGAGVFNYNMEADWFIPTSDFHTQPGSDPAIPEGDGGFAFDLSFGLFYRAENVYMGISGMHLTEPEFKRFDKGLPYKARHFNLTAGYNIRLSNPLFEVRPSFLIQSDTKISQVTLTTLLVYNKRFFGGVSYRASNDAIAIAGLELKNGLRISYSYDYSFSNIRKYNDGSHELSLGYCFTIVKDKAPQKYKSIRFL